MGAGEAGSAVARCDGGGAAEHLAGEGGVVVATEAFLVCAVLAEDRDVARVVGGDDDVAARMHGAGDVGRGLIGFAGWTEIRGCGGRREAGVRGSLVSLACGFGRGVGFGTADEGDRWRVAEVVQRISGGAEELSSLDRSHDGGRYNCGVGFEYLDWAPVSIKLGRTGRPDVGFSVFGATDHIFGIVAEGGVDLGAGIFVAFKLHF